MIELGLDWPGVNVGTLCECP